MPVIASAITLIDAFLGNSTLFKMMSIMILTFLKNVPTILQYLL